MNNRVHQGHFARKRFGQNFLTDQFVIDSIVSAIHPQPGEAVVEIGPGLGALTEPVGARMDRMTVIELDRDLATRLENHPRLKDKLTIHQQDAMTVNFAELAEEAGQPLRVFGNLPYNISTPLMFHLFSYTQAIRDMHFMLQKRWSTVCGRPEQQGLRAFDRDGAVLLQRHSGAGSAADRVRAAAEGRFRRGAPGAAQRAAEPGGRRAHAEPHHHASVQPAAENHPQ